MKYLIRVSALFIMIILIESSIISVVVGSIPNNIDLLFLQNIEMFAGLFNVNPAVALKLILINKPLLVIEKIDVSTGLQLWGLYVMPVSALILSALCLFLILLPVKRLTRHQWYWIVSSSVCLLISIIYLRVQACCTANPAWLVDVILLSRVFNPESNNVFWQQAYLMTSPWLSPLQSVLASASLMGLYFSSRKAFKKHTD